MKSLLISEFFIKYFAHLKYHRRQNQLARRLLVSQRSGISIRDPRSIFETQPATIPITSLANNK